MTIDPRRLLVLSAIASAGGVTAASRVLHISPSAVSQHLAALEREAGTALVARTGTGIVLTPAGQALARRAQQLKEALDGAEDDLAQVTGRGSGVVNVAAYATIASKVVAPAVADLATTDPGLKVTILIESEEAALLHRLMSGSADIAVIEELISPARPAASEGTSPPGTVSRVLFDDPYRIVVPRSWPAAGRAADLLTRPWISGPPESSVRVSLTRIGQAGARAAKVEHECCEFASALDLVAAGLGAAIVPQLALSAPPAGVAVTPFEDAGLRRLYALRLGRPTRPRDSVRTVIDTLADVGQRITGGG
jgi:molybdate transport repressor ModE-like protein